MEPAELEEASLRSTLIQQIVVIGQVRHNYSSCVDAWQPKPLLKNRFWGENYGIPFFKNNFQYFGSPTQFLNDKIPLFPLYEIAK